MEDLGRYLLAFGIVFGLLAIVIRRFGTPTGGGPFAIFSGTKTIAAQWQLDRVSSVRLTPNHTIHIVRIGEQAWVIGCSPNGICLVGDARPSNGTAPSEGGRQ